MLAIRLDDVSDVSDVEVALLIYRFVNLIVFGGDAFQCSRLFGREVSMPFFRPQLVSRLE